MKIFLLYTLALLSLTGCGLISDPGEVKRYTLSSLQELDQNKTRKLHLIVDTPQLYPPIDNTRLALVTSEQTIDYYACAEWGDRLANLIQESLIYSLQNSGRFISVSRPGEGLNTDYTLKLDVRNFQVVYDKEMKPSHARVTYLAQIVRNSTRRVISRKLVHSNQPVTEEKMDLIANSLNLAHLQASATIINWISKYY